MFPRFVWFLAFVLFITEAAFSQTIERGTVKSVDAAKGTITVTVEGKDRSFDVTNDTQIRTAGGGELAGGLKHEAFKVGASINFATREQDGKVVLVGLRPAAANAPNNPGPNPGGDIQRGQPARANPASHRIAVHIHATGGLVHGVTQVHLRHPVVGVPLRHGSSERKSGYRI